MEAANAREEVSEAELVRRQGDAALHDLMGHMVRRRVPPLLSQCGMATLARPAADRTGYGSEANDDPTQAACSPARTMGDPA